MGVGCLDAFRVIYACDTTHCDNYNIANRTGGGWSIYRHRSNTTEFTNHLCDIHNLASRSPRWNLDWIDHRYCPRFDYYPIVGKLYNLWPTTSRSGWIGWLLGGTILYGLIYFYFYAAGTYLSFGKLLWYYALPSAIYTTALGILWSFTPWWKSSFRRS